MIFYGIIIIEIVLIWWINMDFKGKSGISIEIITQKVRKELKINILQKEIDNIGDKSIIAQAYGIFNWSAKKIDTFKIILQN